MRYELQALPGVAEVASVGGMVKQYQVRVDPDRLRAMDIPLAHVRNAIQRGNREIGASVIEMAEAEYMVRTSGLIESVADLRAIPLRTDANGMPVQLGDVAEVLTGPQMRRGLTDLDGEGEAPGGIVVMRAGENASRTIAAVKQRLEALAASLPDGVEIVPVYDRSGLIQRAVDNLWSKLLQEMAVVFVVCALFLFHLRSSLVTVLSLPVGVLTAFLIMHWQGLNANIMSLGGIAIAIGAMIDGAIVMTENLHKHLERDDGNHLSHWQRVTEAAAEVGPALFFSLLIITVSFIPVFTLQAQEGRLFAPLAFTKTYAMAAAAGLAVTLVPVLMGLFIRGGVRPEHRNPLNRALQRGYRPLLGWALNHPALVLLMAAVLMLSALYPLRHSGREFMPPLDEGDLMYMPTTLPGIAIDTARDLLQQTDRMIRSVPEVARVFGKVGRAETATDPAPLTMIETFIQLKPRAQWRPGMDTDAVIRALDDAVQVPGLTNAWVMPIKTRIDMLATGIKTPVGIKIAGPDLAQIERIGGDIEAILNDLPGTASVYAERVTGGRYIQIDIQRNAAARHGLNIDDVHTVIAAAVGGNAVTETVEGPARYPVNLRYPQHWRDSPERLQVLPIVTARGEHIVLGDVAEIDLVDGPPGIKSENAQLNGWVLVDIEGVDVGQYVAQARDAVAERLQLPAGHSIRWSGQHEYMLRARQSLQQVVPMTVLIIALLLFMNFGRLTEVLIVLGTLPMAVTGGLWLAHLAGYNFSIALGVGHIALAGVAVEIGVIMLIYLNQARERLRSQGLHITPHKLREAVLHGAAQRIRPVLMTSVTVIVGLLPIMFGDGTGSDIMRRIAVPMVGGMVSVLMLALFVIPVVYYLVYRESNNEHPTDQST